MVETGEQGAEPVCACGQCTTPAAAAAHAQLGAHVSASCSALGANLFIGVAFQTLRPGHSEPSGMSAVAQRGLLDPKTRAAAAVMLREIAAKLSP